MSAPAIALNRFGLGARPGDAPPADPARWLEAQFAAYQPRLAGLPARAEVAGALSTYLDELRGLRQQMGPRRQRGQADAADGAGRSE